MLTNCLTVRVAAVRQLADRIKGLRLVPTDGAWLPGFAPGAHVQVGIPAPGSDSAPAQWRSYSLINLDPAADTSQEVAEYRIAVRLEDDGHGGSRHIHENVREGDVLTLRPPVNHFPLEAPLETILLAGGIGATPIASMAAALVSARRPFVLHYSGRSYGQLALVDELRALAGERLVVHADDDPVMRLSIDALLAAKTPGQPIYVCGPSGMIDAVCDTAARLGWPKSAVHFERFTEATPLEGDAPFEVELKSSGRVVSVGADQSLLDALLDAGVDAMYDCRSGYCGLCSTRVCSGEIEHRDSYLQEDDKAANDVMQICVSRAKRGRLVLDL
jgi:vanillate O-demethylase ferredoxin subunit